jgi:xanthine dehydrogenase small subunit
MSSRASDGLQQSTKRGSLRFVFRGEIVDVDQFKPRETLLDWLRTQARATGTKEGCGEGDCGACTVVLARPRDGGIKHRPVNACILLLGQCDGAEILTIEDLAADGALHPVQSAMVAHHASQCGFCTPGIVMSLFSHYQEAPRPTSREAICDQLAGNLCRCTGYRPIVDAALEVCAAPAQDQFTASRDARAGQLAAIDDAADLFVGAHERFFAAPASFDALADLAAAHPDALILAGATDVGLWITKGMQDPQKIIWVGRVAGFDTIFQHDGVLELGAGATHQDALPYLAAQHPDLGEIMRRFGSTQVRASGTVGGSIANGSPIGDLAPCLIALGARVHLRLGDAERSLPLEDFFIAYRKQDRAPGEIVTRLSVQELSGTGAFRAYKVSKRFDEDISAVLGAFHFTLEGRTITAARIAYGGMAGTPARARKAEAACAGLSLDDERTWSAALDAIGTDYNPLSDLRASAAYRRTVARNLLRKALIEIAGGAMGQTRLRPGGLADAAE